METQPPPEDQVVAYKIYTMYKRPENLESPLSAPRGTKSSVYAMNDQTFHTPSFGDEEFDIPMIHGQHAAAAGGGVPTSHIQYTQLHHAAPQVGMMNPAQDGLAPPGGAPSYQQPLYLQEPHTPVTSHSAAAPAGNYIIQQQPGGQQRLLMMQPAQVMSGPPTPSTPTQPSGPVYGSPQRASPPGTTSDDSDDSVPSHHSQLPGDAESLLPIHYCSASRQQQTTLHQIAVPNNLGVKRSSPEPIDNGVNRGQMQKKPKVQKKKKKRDPNEPQKPVSAYALFFRDTQAAIKGQNPNASFGEVSKIVASMWDGLDSEHKSVYKQKTEVAKKEYLKALAAYRASLVSKGGEQENQTMYNHTNSANPAYGNYYQGQTYGNGHSPQGYVPSPAPQGYSPQSYPGGQPQTSYPGQQAQGYPANPQQSPQNYPAGMAHNTQTYQGIQNQTPQSYQVNPAASPQNCQPGLGQSPRNYQPTQSPPNYPPNSGVSPPGYRQVQPQTPPMGVHPMQYHHPQQQMQQQMQQVHQAQQYQQQHQPQQHQPQHQQQHAQQHQPQSHQPQPHQQHQSQPHQPQHQPPPHQAQQPQQIQQSPMQPPQHQNTIQQTQIQQNQIQQNQQMQQNQHQPTQQQQQNHQQQNQQQQSQAPKNEQHSPNNNGSAGIPQQSPDNENRSTPSCIRQGCTNPAIANSEWEDEYCSNECVVSHCRDVFSSWVASNNSNQIQNFSAVK